MEKVFVLFSLIFLYRDLFKGAMLFTLTVFYLLIFKV